MADNVYFSISFGSIPRDQAEQIRESAEQITGDASFSVSFGEAIGENDPTPIGDEAAAAVGTDAQLTDTVAPDAEQTPADAPVVVQGDPEVHTD